MTFTYQAYRDMLLLLQESGYSFQNYDNYQDAPRCVILRHDIDYNLEASVKLAELEANAGIHSTYFVLLRTDFYNVASKAGQSALRHILSLGHKIGLHFDETAYRTQLTLEELSQNIIKECGLLSALLETAVSSVSMHRPSKTTLESDLYIPEIVNSYGKTFFKDFKYLSDSRRHWREPVLDIIRSGEYSRLHILTHAFWYHDKDQSLFETVNTFIHSANQALYHQMEENITNIAEIGLQSFDI